MGKTKKEPWEMRMVKRKLSPDTSKAKFDSLTEIADQKNFKNGCFNYKWLTDVLIGIDKLWFEGKLLWELTKEYGGLRLRIVIKDEEIGGYTCEPEKRDFIALHMNPCLIAGLFVHDVEYAYQSGGVLCETRLQCVLHCLLHEVLHLVYTLCDKRGYWNDDEPHGIAFLNSLKNLFNQTSIQHGMRIGRFHTLSLEDMRKKARTAKYAWMFDEGKKKWTRISIVPTSEVKKSWVNKMQKLNPSQKEDIVYVRNKGKIEPIHLGVLRMTNMNELLKDYDKRTIYSFNPYICNNPKKCAILRVNAPFEVA
jgi:hypothetical protein